MGFSIKNLTSPGSLLLGPFQSGFGLFNPDSLFFGNQQMNIPELGAAGNTALMQMFSTLSRLKDLESNPLLKQLQDVGEKGFIPTEADIASTARLFAPREAALKQSFEQQQMMANRQAAQFGRASIDPTIQGMLRKSFMQQSDMMQAEKQAGAVQTMQNRFLAGLQGLNTQQSLLTSQLSPLSSIFGTEKDFQKSTISQSKTPGIFDYLGAAAGIAGTAGKGIGAMKGAPTIS